MTTENQNVEQVQEQAPELSPIQQKALDQGWKPKEQFDGNEDEFIDAAEFVRRGELFEKIERQSREVRQLRDTLEAFKQHHSKVQENAYHRALKQVEAARRKAFEEQDSDRFFALEQHIDQIKEEMAAVQEEAAPVQEQVDLTPLNNWMEKNPWYESNRAMTAFANQLGAELKSKGVDLVDALKQIDAEMRKEFPEKFAVKRPPSPEGSTRSGSGSGPKGYQPSELERSVAKKFVKQGLYKSEAEYYKELQRLQGE